MRIFQDIQNYYNVLYKWSDKIDIIRHLSIVATDTVLDCLEDLLLIIDPTEQIIHGNLTEFLGSALVPSDF